MLQYAQDAAMLSCNSPCSESLGFKARDCVNQNEHQQIFRFITVNICRAYKAIFEIDWSGSECMALLL